MDFRNGDIITAGDTNVNELTFISPMVGQSQVIIAYVQILSSVSGIKFSSGEGQVNANSHLFQAGDQFPISFVPGKQNLFFQASNAADTFVITV